MNWEKAVALLKSRKAEPYRVRQLGRAVFQGSIDSYAQAHVLPAPLREALAGAVPLLSVSATAMTRSKDGTVKALLGLADGGQVETVLMRPTPTRWTACVSTQTGCALGCAFCATGAGGPGRDLAPEEITDQVLFWRQFLRREASAERLSNVVYMGMGEPFLNYESFQRSLRVLLDQRLFGIGARHVAVSTAGLAPQMERFAADFPQVNLALSLHAANDRLRDRLVPINRTYPLEVLARTLKNVFVKNNRKVFLEYVILKGENDSAQDAAELVGFVRSVDPKLLHVNLLPHNPAGRGAVEAGGRAPPTPSGRALAGGGAGGAADADAREFQKRLRDAGLVCTVRQSFGRDILAACGQLAAQRDGTPRRIR